MTVVRRIGEQVRSRLGIHLGAHKEYLLESRLERLKAQEGYKDLESFLSDLEQGHPQALEALARHLTTNHTFFFRESEHLTLLVKLLRRSGLTQPRVWSAAGSTGEEGYSLAMVLTEAGFRDFMVLVSDVSREVLVKGHRGIFEANRVEKVPLELVPRYFHRLVTGEFRVTDDLRSHLRFRRLNLFEDMVLAEAPDAIFCRNLLIYFDPQGAQEVLGRLVQALKPGGWLFLGHSEGFHRPPGPMERIGPSVFQKQLG